MMSPIIIIPRGTAALTMTVIIFLRLLLIGDITEERAALIGGRITAICK